MLDGWPSIQVRASGPGYKLKEGRGFLLGNGEEAGRSALWTTHALLPASDARHASAEVARKIGLAEAKGGANPANLFWAQGGPIRREARHSHAHGLPPAVLCAFRESSHQPSGPPTLRNGSDDGFLVPEASHRARLWLGDGNGCKKMASGGTWGILDWSRKAKWKFQPKRIEEESCPKF